jgi:hypothetical protein
MTRADPQFGEESPRFQRAATPRRIAGYSGNHRARRMYENCGWVLRPRAEKNAHGITKVRYGLEPSTARSSCQRKQASPELGKLGSLFIAGSG